MKELSIERIEMVSGGAITWTTCRPVIGFYWMGLIQLAISLYEGCPSSYDWDKYTGINQA
jgi:hypothetical protein